ncbi:MAG: site-2 protease family protein [Micrococcales bacterium]|nr:site-2 protease family protein [Micrococcales bacterium]
MMSVLSVIVFVLLLLISVAWHELGHMIPAKLFGVRVNSYFIGVGPTVWSRRRGETEYGIKALPFGGFVRMAGMYPPERTGEPPRSQWRANLEDEVRAFSRQEVDEAGEKRSFFRQSAPRKAIIMLGGPTANLLLAVILAGVVMCGIGTHVATTTLSGVSDCLAWDGTSVECSDPRSEPGPAASAGLRAGDTVTVWDGVEVATWKDLTDAIQGARSGEVSVEFERDGVVMTASVTPYETYLDDIGEQVRKVGIVAGDSRERQPMGSVPGVVWDQIASSSSVYARLPVLVWRTGVDMLVGHDRRIDSPISPVGIVRFTAEVTSEMDASGISAGDIWAERWSLWLWIAVSLNLALWMFNLLPLLPLDGGHIAGAVVEGVRRSWARLRRRSPLPGPLDLARVVPLTYGVFALIILMTLVLVTADIVNPVGH